MKKPVASLGANGAAVGSASSPDGDLASGAGADEAILLVGHGGVARDCPPAVASEWKRLESARRREGRAEPCARELELDGVLRSWPRTPENDPYYFGLSHVREHLQSLHPDRLVRLSFNEFAGPSVTEALDQLVEDGAQSIVVISTMLTPGGFHSECEIPEEVELARARHVGLSIRYVWPVPESVFAGFLSGLIEGG